MPATWTTPRTWVTGELVTATIGNSAWRDNLMYLKDSPTFDGTPTVTGNLTLTAALISNSATDATSTLTGAIQTDGGLGVVKALWVGGLANVAGAVTLQSTLNVTGNITGTLATASQPNVTTMAALTTVGALNAGSITSGFGSIDVGSDAIAGGAISGTTGAYSRTVTITDASDEIALSVLPTHATYTSTAIKVNSTRAANSAFTLLDVQANSVSQFKVSGDGLITATGAGTHTLTSAHNASQTLMLANTTSGTAASCGFQTQASGVNGTFRAFSTGFTTAGSAMALAARLNADATGGLILSASNASGNVSIWAGGTADANRVSTFFSTGGVSIGDTTDPGDNNFRVAGTSKLVGTVTHDGATTLTGAVTISNQVAITDANNESVLVVQPTHATYTGNAMYANTTRAANPAFNLLRLDANSVQQFGVSGIGSVSIGSANISDSAGTPTIASGFRTAGAAAAIAGKDFAFVITMGGDGGGAITSGIVNFGITFANAPIAVANHDQDTSPIIVSTSTTQVTLSSGGGSWVTGTKLFVHVRGY